VNRPSTRRRKRLILKHKKIFTNYLFLKPKHLTRQSYIGLDTFLYAIDRNAGSLRAVKLFLCLPGVDVLDVLKRWKERMRVRGVLQILRSITFWHTKGIRRIFLNRCCWSFSLICSNHIGSSQNILKVMAGH